ncbi:hypothetical protein RvY_01308 [Ramazzottius varieornatus]|uniref:Uncharacterized protein n=1 Tax=Ramazzottius varieornatus TaxID=947166 RepID=A0A1D1UN03_RAMVA|nr:hypothetical protein RvY_01308 [Ramazzottius varieornatus]
MDLQEEGLCFRGEGCSNEKPWQDSTYKFKITKVSVPGSRYQCTGCRTSFMKKPAEQYLLVIHVEQDFENGSGGVIAWSRFRLYHMNNRCIKIRHSKFHSDNDVIQDKILQKLSGEERAAIRNFRSGYIV